MPLTPNTKLGPYEIISPIGAGGMGEVYRAKDLRLDRDVAIKVLPAHLTRSLEFKQRFEREAKSISQLTHPHICTLHDVGQQDGIDYLVMELLEGETLAQRLTKGPLSLDLVLRHGVEVASALEAAHRKGVVHRDLKPGNVMLTKSGAKLLDFGLAKSASALESDPSAVTVSQPLTTKGTILGTFQYMAPEQLEGADADARTDIFAYGAVLYEMATGKRAFEGHSRASLIASIMSSRPRPISELQPMTPPALDHLLRMCLAKDPEERIQTAHDVKLQLEWMLQGGTQAGIPAPVTARRKHRERLAWVIAVVGLLASGGMLATLVGRTSVDLAPVRATILPPEGTTLVSTSIFAGPVNVSPDGSRLAFVARKVEGRTMLWVHALHSSVAQALEGTEGASRPFWSADGRQLGFFTDRKMKKIDASGGPVLTLAEAPEPRGGTWNSDGMIVFAPQYTGPLYVVSAAGGAAKPITELDRSRDEDTHRYPHFLPDGKHFLFLARSSSAGTGREPIIVAAALDSAEKKIVMQGASSVAYASGHLLFIRQNTLMAQPFDAARLETSGDAVALVQDVRMDERFSLGVFSVSQDGILAYQTGKEESQAQLFWFDRAGKRLETVGAPESYYPGFLNLSPNGTRVAVGILDAAGLSDIWLVDLERGIRSKFTLDPGDDSDAVWSPDGSHIVYSTRASNQKFTLARKATTSAGIVEPLLTTTEDDFSTTDWSGDGEFILYAVQPRGKKNDLWALPLDGDRTPIPVVKTDHDEGDGRFSPDSRWIAYVSDASGRHEVYVAPFPGPGGTLQVSQHGGTEPRWRADGKEMFYFAGDNRLMAVEITTEGGAFEVGQSTPLFQARETWIPGAGVRYDVSEDGQRFLVFVPQADPAASNISLIVNWPQALKRK